MEYLRAVIWPRQKEKPDKKNRYKYVIIGMLVTDEPIESLEKLDKYETVIDSRMYGLSMLLDMAQKRDPKIKIGTADDILVQLGEI